MTEIDVTLTDYALTLLSLFFVFQLQQQKSLIPRHKHLWMTFFAAFAAGSLIGGTVHGFSPEGSSAYRYLWPATLLATGIAAASVWQLTGLYLAPPKNFGKWALSSFLIFGAVVVFVSQKFLVVIVYYLPAIVSLLGVSIGAYRRTRAPAFFFLIVGVLISFVAALVQQLHLGLHEKYFNHNSVAHVIQALSLWSLFRGAKDLIAKESAP